MTVIAGLVLPATAIPARVTATVLVMTSALALISLKQIDRSTPPVPQEVIPNIKQDYATVSERAHR